MFDNAFTRYDMTNASVEVVLMMAVAFALGFVFCYVQAKKD